jgi:cytochrome P450
VTASDADDIVLALMETPQPDDPYPLYHRLREIAPNHPSIMGMRFLSRYDDCVEMLRSPSFHMAVAEVSRPHSRTSPPAAAPPSFSSSSAWPAPPSPASRGGSPPRRGTRR